MRTQGQRNEWGGSGYSTALLFAAALLAGCTGAGNPCSDSAPCPAGYACTQGACKLCDPAAPPVPTLSCAPATTVECTGGEHATVVLSYTEQLGCGLPAITDTIGPNAYPLGLTSVTFSSKEGGKNAVTCTTSLLVQDTTPPTISCPPNGTYECTGNGSAAVNPGHAVASDTCSTPTVTEPGTGSFPLGVTTVTHSAKDSAGNVATCTQTIEVQDTTPPSLVCPAPLVAECTGNGAAFVTPGAAAVSDTCGTPTLIGPATGAYPVGTTEVAYIAKDLGGNVSTCTATIEVRDTQPPQLTCPQDLTVECINGQARINVGRATVSDTCATPSLTAPPNPAVYPLGVSVLSYVAKDAGGNVSTCQQQVTVQDTSAPVVAAGPASGPAKALWPASDALVTIDLLADCQLTAQDTCDGALVLRSSNVQAGCVTSNEARANSGGADVVFVDATHVQLWAQSSGGGAGRIYRIPLTVKDASGNKTTAVCRVDVGAGPAFPTDSGAVAQTVCPSAPQECSGSVCGAPFVYAAGGTSLHGFSLDPATGALTELAASPFAIPSLRIARHPNANFIYVTDSGTNSVAAFAVGADGALAQVGMSLATGTFPETIVVDPSGGHLYVGNVDGGGTSVYAIDAGTGGITADGSIDAGLYNHGLSFDATGHYLYLARNNSNDVTRYQVNPATGVASEPVTLAATGGYHTAIDPLGRFLFVSDWDKGGGNLLSVYRLSSLNGTLSKVNDYDTGGSDPAGVAVTPDGRFVYAVNASSGTIAGFSVGAGGVLSALTGSPFALGGGAWELSIDPEGKWLFAGHGDSVATFAIDSGSGGLTQASSLLAGGASPAAGATVVVLVH